METRALRRDEKTGKRRPGQRAGHDYFLLAAGITNVRTALQLLEPRTDLATCLHLQIHKEQDAYGRAEGVRRAR